MPTLLDGPLITDTLISLPGWEGGPDQIFRDVRLAPEQDAELRRQVAVDADAMGHPAVVEQRGGATRFVLRTAEVGGVSELDIALASHISDMVHRLSPDEPGVKAARHDDPVIIIRPGESAAEHDGHMDFPHHNQDFSGVPSGNAGTPQTPLPSTHSHAPEPGVSSEQEWP
ncbi:MAG: 4a-hydroxytetrahydrobiopterin dehydratase [Mycobacteriales bacterium]